MKTDWFRTNYDKQIPTKKSVYKWHTAGTDGISGMNKRGRRQSNETGN